MFRYSRLQPFLDQPQYPIIGNADVDELQQPLVIDMLSKKPMNVRIENPVHSLPLQSHIQRVQRLMRVAPRPEPVREALKSAS